jgi:hypothetical protein
MCSVGVYIYTFIYIRSCVCVPIEQATGNALRFQTKNHGQEAEWHRSTLVHAWTSLR